MANFRDMEIKDDAERKEIPKAAIDVQSMLKEQGFEFLDYAGNGEVVVKSQDGTEGNINVKGMVNDLLTKKQVDPSQYDLDIQINTPDTPIDRSTLSEARRGQLALGTFGQKYNKLKELYGEDGVDYRPDTGLLYKENGVWYKVDAGEAPITFQNEKGEFDIGINTNFYEQYQKDWRELSRDLADLPDVAINILATTYTAGKGAVAGTLAGAPLGPIGAFAGAGIGGAAGAGMGGAASAGIKSILGKVVGLGEADPDELKEEIVIEAMMSMGGQALSWGAKPTLQAIVNGVKALKKGTDGVGKSVISGVLGSYSKAGSDAIKNVIDEPGKWGMKMKALANESADSDQLAQKAFNNGVEKTRTLLTKATERLPEKWKELMDEMTASPKITKLEVDTDSMFINASDTLAEKGFGRIIKEGDDFKFTPLTRAEQALRQQQGLPVEVLDDTALKEINDIMSSLNVFSGQKLKGKPAANTLVGMNRTINTVGKDAFKKGVSPSTQRFVGEFGGAFKNQVTNQFNAAEMGLEYKTMQDVYGVYANPVKQARKMLESGNREDIDNLFKQLNSQVGTAEGTKRVANSWIDLIGDEGKSLLDEIRWDYTIFKTAPWAPKIGAVQALGILGTGGTVGLAQASPRVAANEAALLSKAYKASGRMLPQGVRDAANNVWKLPDVQYNLLTLDTIKSMSPAARRELLRDPKLLRGVLTAPGMAIEGEIQETELMNQYIQDSLNRAQ